MLTKAWTKFKYHKVQQEAWRCKKRFVSIPAGRGSGKTELAKRRLVRYLPIVKDDHDCRYFYGAPTERQAKRIAWDHFLKLIPADWIKSISISELMIITKFGTSLYVVGMDKPQRIEGGQWDGCVLDESCDLKPGIFDRNIMPALTWYNAWCWRIGVPKRQGVGAAEFRDFFERSCDGLIDDAAGFTWPSKDIVPDVALKQARDTLDIKDYREQFEARFETAGGGIFHGFDKEYNVRPCSYNKNAPLIIGCDFNVDPMAWVVCQVNNKVIEVLDEIWLRDTNTPESLDVLHARYTSHVGGFQFYGDAAARQRKTSASMSDYKHIYNDSRFKELGRTVHFPQANPRLADRFASTNAMLCNSTGNRRIFVNPSCTRLITDLQNRYYKPGTNDPDDSGDLGHITDAFGYVIHYLFPIKMKLEYTSVPQVFIS